LLFSPEEDGSNFTRNVDYDLFRMEHVTLAVWDVRGQLVLLLLAHLNIYEPSFIPLSCEWTPAMYAESERACLLILFYQFFSCGVLGEGGL
jgi:hypothetical protein